MTERPQPMGDSADPASPAMVQPIAGQANVATDQAFRALYALMLESYPEPWELPRRLLECLSRRGERVPLRELCLLAAEAVGLEGAGEYALEDYRMLVGHAIALTRRRALEFRRTGANPAGFWITRVEGDTDLGAMIGWEEQPEKMAEHTGTAGAAAAHPVPTDATLR